jgi:pyrroline-5-carboxylate reductase
MNEVPRIGFIGGGNMANALIGGLVRNKTGASFVVIEPHEATRAALETKFGVRAHSVPHPDLAGCDAIVFAVKPQQFREAADAVREFVAGRLVVSIAAGIRSTDISRWLGGHPLVIRCMPNTPALIGAGITALFAASAVGKDQKALAETLLGAVGETLWVDDETQLDAVTALSGSGPAYVFYFVEAMERAAAELGLDAGTGRRLAIATFLGASKLAAQSDEPVSTLRERVTSKGGTTYAALTSMDAERVSDAIVRAIHAANVRSKELGDELGKE